MEREIVKEKKVRDVDPFGELSKSGERIASILASTDSHLDLNIIGTLHTGHIGNDIKDHILSSDWVTLELPAISVRSYLSGDESRIERGEFWAELIDFAVSSGKTVIGVNNDRDAVDGIRAIEQRFPDDYTQRSDKADITFSSRSFGEVFPDEPEHPYTVFLPLGDYIELVGNEEASLYPVVSMSDFKFGPIFYHQYTNIDRNGKSRAAFSGNDWALPIELAMTYDEEFSKHAGQYPILQDLRRFALSHMSRLRVDREQAKGILEAIEKDPKLKTGMGLSKDFIATHIGGAAHNPNLRVMMDKAFKSGNVSVSVGVDDRVFPLAADHLTFFSELVDPGEALRAITVHEGEVFVHREKTEAVIKQAVQKAGSDRLRAYYRRESIVNDFTSLKARGEKRYYVEDYALAALLEMLPTDMLDGFSVSASLPYQVAEQVMLHFPDRLDDVFRILRALDRKEDHFFAEE